jgi:hypothetical protein
MGSSLNNKCEKSIAYRERRRALSQHCPNSNIERRRTNRDEVGSLPQWLPQSTRCSDPLNAPAAEPVQPVYGQLRVTSNAQKLKLAQRLRHLLGRNNLDRLLGTLFDPLCQLLVGRSDFMELLPSVSVVEGLGSGQDFLSARS